jgi:hypothetical protein
MATTNPYFSQGTRNEQYLIEDIIIESLKIYGQEMFYIPRTLVAKDEILGEDRLSQFNHLFPIEMYFENVTAFDGQGWTIQKFGMLIDQSATLTVARRRWDQMVGRYGKTQLPYRPCEGDLIYFPLTKGLFEIKFVNDINPLFQLGKLYVYKLDVELFQYASERISTGTAEVDVFETLKTHDIGQNVDIDTPQSFGDNNKFKQQAETLVFDNNNPFGDIVTSPLIPTGQSDSNTETADSEFITTDNQ